MLNTLPIIDAHVHLWDTDRMNYPWLETVPPIQRTFLVADYQKASVAYQVEKMVFVQCECLPEQHLEEVRFVTEQARIDKRIQGIVAYAPLERGKSVESVLVQLKANSLVKGVRRMYDDNPALCHSPAFIDGLRTLSLFGFSFDISVKPHAIPATIRMIEKCPDTLFILDHLGKPDINNGSLALFKEHVDVLAAFPNVVAKVSGLLTEADWQHWRPEQLVPFVQYAIEKFGFDRLLFGSDWPVVLLAGSYGQWLETLDTLLSEYSEEERIKLFYTNATRIYRLDSLK